MLNVECYMLNGALKFVETLSREVIIASWRPRGEVYFSQRRKAAKRREISTFRQ